jgi:diguanylate cyclase (GGDEF)-like protein
MASVLVVDDQPANVRILAAALRDQCEVVSAFDGSTALATAAAGDVDLILLDVVLPDIDGFEVCRRLKADERTRHIPVIFVTSLEDVHDETMGFDVGGVDYITKPIRAPIVRARVRTHLELKQARDLLESLAMIDAVTGIANRRRFNESLEQEWKRAVRSGSSLSIGIADLDYFKKLNDIYGHASGDSCLRAVAQALRGVVRRPADLVARYGGEEFGLVFPESDANAMRALVRNALDAIRNLGIPHSGSLVATFMTISIGAVTLVPAKAGGDPLSALETADRLLYDAKRMGRNQARYLDLGSGEHGSIA